MCKKVWGLCSGAQSFCPCRGGPCWAPGQACVAGVLSLWPFPSQPPPLVCPRDRRSGFFLVHMQQALEREVWPRPAGCSVLKTLRGHGRPLLCVASMVRKGVGGAGGDRQLRPWAHVL